ncbi:MAG: aspartate--tRNA(Asn) ligase [Thaumarchaeota archaeon]|nr:aspartate--tRNA(Asn) ligase [Nitrososphaerota archaeon]
MSEEELGGWRRTHYSSQIKPSLNDSDVLVMGWVSSIRDHGNIVFIMLTDKQGEIQVTAKLDECGKELFDKIREVKEHSSIGVKGRVRNMQNAPNGAEVVPKEVQIFSMAKKVPPFQVYSKTVANIDTRLELRAVDLRRRVLQAVFKIRHGTLNAVREFLNKEGFIEVNTPKMIATATEGGAALFPIFYYDREAFLAQSPQLYKEQLTMAFEQVFEIAPIFRAEPSRTMRHLSEAISIDVEEAFSDYNDVIHLLERIVVYVIEYVARNNPTELEVLQSKIAKPELPFPRYTYNELVELLRKEGERIEWGDDFSTDNLKKLGCLLQGYYFITDWPSASKPFYAKPKPTDEKLCESFDLMFGELEISSGSSRINSKDELLERMRKQGLNPEAFDYHLRAFDYGMPPHAGFGLGLERFLMTFTGVENIRDVTFYPRDIDRLTP